MNEYPCSNQEIHALFEHWFKLENTENELELMKVLQTRLVDIIWSMFLFKRYQFESLQPIPFCLEKSCVRKRIF